MLGIADPKIAAHSQRFFKTGKGEYGEGDRFIGIRVPELRTLVRTSSNLSLPEIQSLLNSSWHEQRLLALLILVDRFAKGDEAVCKRIVTLYLAQTNYINNWDLVDSSAPKITGPWFFRRNKSPLYRFAKSGDLWQRRIAIMSGLYFIKNDEFEDVLELAGILLRDEHDLIHKATGWMLREVGNKNIEVEQKFLIENYHEMPRTMLRYAIEKFPEAERKKYLRGDI